MNALVLLFGGCMLLPVSAWLEARSPSPWISEAQKRNKTKKELQEAIKKMEADRQKNRIRTAPKIQKNVALALIGGG